jgi:chemotaxis protein methyltransferase CheR
VVETARSAIYSQESVSNLPADVLRQNFLEGKGRYAGLVQVKPHIRGLVKFRRLNLFEGVWPFRGKFDAIFCRNVMIYFDREVQRRVLEQFARYLKPGGLLFVGHSENLFWLGSLFRSIGGTVYVVSGVRGDA